jgi:hypothetical protein
MGPQAQNPPPHRCYGTPSAPRAPGLPGFGYLCPCKLPQNFPHQSAPNPRSAAQAGVQKKQGLCWASSKHATLQPIAFQLPVHEHPLPSANLDSTSCLSIPSTPGSRLVSWQWCKRQQILIPRGPHTSHALKARFRFRAHLHCSTPLLSTQELFPMMLPLGIKSLVRTAAASLLKSYQAAADKSSCAPSARRVCKHLLE